jgi:carboxylesterase
MRVMPLFPGAEPFRAEGGPVGVVLCHGFTGSPRSMRPWAEHLAAAGLTVSLPRLPGHGSTWQDLALTRWPDWYAAVDRAFDELTARCESVFVMGLSMGGTLALRLAEQRGRDVSGVVVVNPSLLSLDRRLAALPVIRRLGRVLPTVAGISQDIRRPGQDEGAYDRVPVAALHSLTELWAVTRRELAQITQPLLVLRSAVDHVVEPESTELLLATVSSTDVTQLVLHDSFHVATLDHDAERIFTESLEFVHRLAPAGVTGHSRRAGG